MYSPKFKEKMVQRMLNGSSRGVELLAADSGVSKSTLYRWLRASVAGRMADEETPDVSAKARRALTAMDKARLLAEADALPEHELGAWLRTNGLHTADLDQWREAIVAALDPAEARKRRKAESKQRREGDRRIKKLERELRKKDKALAEAAAILVLRKKAQALWGDEDDDTDPS